MNNKIAIFLILMLCVICLFIFGNNINSPYSDIGRELYIPQQMLQGSVLYKDIFCDYPPLGYMLNTLWIKLFGDNLITYYIIGFVLSFISLTACYFITAIYINKKTALALSVTFIPVCVFFPSVSNWITPYSYSILYALASFLWSFYFLVKYIKDSENSKINFALCSLLFGFSISCKYEFMTFFIVMLLCLIKYKKGLKEILYIFVFPVICIFILLIQKCSINDLFIAGKLIIKLTQSKSVNFFYNYLGIIPGINSIKNAVLSVIYPHFPTLFQSAGYITALIFLFNIKKIKNDFAFFVLNLTALLAVLKVIGNIKLEIYGTYFLPIALILLFTFLYKKLFREKSLILISICVVLFISYFSFDISENKLIPVETQKGTIKVKDVFYQATKEAIDYINTQTLANETILVMPESAVLNYITNRKSNNILYYLIPPNTEILTDDYIIKELNNNPPDVILMSNLIYQWYNEGFFMQSWGKNIYQYIKENYKFEKEIGDGVQFYVFRHVIM